MNLYTPLYVDGYSHLDRGDRFAHIRDRTGQVLVKVGGHHVADRQNDADDIVRACNSHENLLKACKRALAYLDSQPVSEPPTPQLTGVQLLLRIVIASAQEEE